MTEPTSITYLLNFHLFSPSESHLLCNYKQFIENTIMKLGEDWRIQSNLLALDIVAVKQKQESEKMEKQEFNIFNEFLSAFLIGKIGMEYEYTTYLQSHVQQQFLAAVTEVFSVHEKVEQSLTFKTLSLGYCITATDVWNRIFKNSCTPPHKNLLRLKPFAILTFPDRLQPTFQESSNIGISTVRRQMENIDLVSYNMSVASKLDQKSQQKSQQNDQKDTYSLSESVRWRKIEKNDELKEEEIVAIRASLNKVKHNLKTAHTLLQFVGYVDELKLPSGRLIRILTISNEFYLLAFIVWLIFSIKMFFNLNFTDYKRYFQVLTGEAWSSKFQRPLKKFQTVIEREWNKLLKDYTVALHDDINVLNILIDRVRKQIQSEWDACILQIQQSFSKQ